MQSLLRRTQRAVAQNQRRAKKEGIKAKRTRMYENIEEQKKHHKKLRDRVEAVRQQRWEEWHMGPLAPKKEYSKDELKELKREIRPPPDNLIDVKGRLVWKKHADRGYKFPPKKLSKKEKKDEKAKAGIRESKKRGELTSTFIDFKPGDRVAIGAKKARSRQDWGKIATILEVDKDKQRCIVDGINTRRIDNPAYRTFSSPTDPDALPDGPETLLQHHPIPMSHLRRVVTRTNPATGIPEDVLLGLSAREKSLAKPIPKQARQRPTPEPTPEEEEEEGEEKEEPPAPKQPSKAQAKQRKRELREALDANDIEKIEKLQDLKNPNIPDKDPDDKPDPNLKKTQRLNKLKRKMKFRQILARRRKVSPIRSRHDTMPVHLKAVTWTPPLLSAPMPAGVIDELRNKYSVFRTRHDPEYVAKMKAIDERREKYDEWAKSGGGMLDSPLKELSLLRREERAAKGVPALSPGVLEGIGGVMARNGVKINEERMEGARRNLELGEVVGLGRGDVRAEGEGEGDRESGMGELEGKVGDLVIEDAAAGTGNGDIRPEA